MMRDMSTVKTIYSDCSNKQLFGLFHSKNWATGLTPFERQQAMQELSNRYAYANGAQPVPLKTENIAGLGCYSPSKNEIVSSSYLVNEGKTVSQNGLERYYNDANLRCMSNVFHETTHVFQKQSETNPQLYQNEEARKNILANMNNYITPSSDFDLYRIQLMEKEANDRAEAKTTAVMRSLEADHGKDPSMQYYAGSISGAYRECLRNAQLKYNDPHITQTMQKAMNDNYYNGRAIPANEKTSYYQVRSILAKEQLRMEFDRAQPNRLKIDALQKELADLSKQQALAEKREETQSESSGSGTLPANGNGRQPSKAAQAQAKNGEASRSADAAYGSDDTNAALPREAGAADGVGAAGQNAGAGTAAENDAGNNNTDAASGNGDYSGMSM